MSLSPELAARIRQRTAGMRAAARPAVSPPRVGPCRFLGAATGETVPCASCGGRKVALKLFACAIWTQCVQVKHPPGVASCAGCKDYAP